jgi:hypothetical protein
MPMRRFLAVASVAIVALVTLPSAARAAAGWINDCPFSHAAMDDPIVFPREPGASHRHDFLGNETTDAYSTYRSLRNGSTTCDMNADRAAYWAPTLYKNGQKYRPRDVAIYYRDSTTPLRAVRAFPAGLRIVAGDVHSKTRQSTNVISWGCGDHNRDHPVACGKDYVVAHVKFPDCWDGKHLDSIDHKRHMAYSIDRKYGEGRRCPNAHPVPVPRLIVRIEWPIHDGRSVYLSSGPPKTMHGDFFNAWSQPKLKQLVNRCIHRDVDCGHPGD